ncbi:MAG: PASTA domain-containing protein [Dissulfuribacterales bacterium]
MIRSIVKIAGIFIGFLIIAGISAYLTVSFVIKNEGTVVVPNLVGEDIVSALELLTNLGLNTKVKGNQYSPKIPKNSIVYQEPEPGDMIKKGRDIRVVISKGTRIVAMPNLTGLSLQSALLILEKNGLDEGMISKPYSLLIKKDAIISQFPAQGSEVERGTKTDLLVSMGKRHAESVMPELTGRYLEEAVLDIEKNKLEIGTINPVYHKDKPANIILDQSPPSGYHVTKNQRVDLKVNRKTMRNAADHKKEFYRGALFRYKLPPGYLRQHIRLELRTFGMSCIVYDELMEPEKEIWAIIPGAAASVVFLYKNDMLIETKIYD